MCEDTSKKETAEVAKNPEETSQEVVSEDDLYESSSESDQETEIGSGICSMNLGGVGRKYGPGPDLGSLKDAWRSRPQLASTNMGQGANLSLGALPRNLTHSSPSSSSSTLPVSPPSGFYMDPAPYPIQAPGVEVSGSFGKREELLFPSTSPVLTSTISSTLFASSISSLRLIFFLVCSLSKC